MKLDYTLSKVFQEMSSSELEALHYLCELECTHILQSLTLEVLKIPYAGSLLSSNRSNFIDCEENISCTTRLLKKFQRYTFLKINDVTKKSQYTTKIKYILLIHSHDAHIVGIQLAHVVLKKTPT